MAETETTKIYNVRFVCNYCVVTTTVAVEDDSDPVATATQLLLDEMGLDFAVDANDIEIERV